VKGKRVSRLKRPCSLPWFLGIDCTFRKRQVCLRDANGGWSKRKMIDHTGDGLGSRSLDSITRNPVYRYPSMKEDLNRFLPLPPAALHILLCLAGDARHGYGIMQEVSRQSNGQFRLRPGTLYDNLQKLMAHGMVEDQRRAPEGDNPRRRYYRLTSLGRRVLAADVERLKSVVQEATVRLRNPRLKRV